MGKFFHWTRRRRRHNRPGVRACQAQTCLPTRTCGTGLHIYFMGGRHLPGYACNDHYQVTQNSNTKPQPSKKPDHKNNSPARSKGFTCPNESSFYFQLYEFYKAIDTTTRRRESDNIPHGFFKIDAGHSSEFGQKRNHFI